MQIVFERARLETLVCTVSFSVWESFCNEQYEALWLKKGYAVCLLANTFSLGTLCVCNTERKRLGWR